MTVERGLLRTDPRTVYEAIFEIEYGAALATRHCVLYRNLDRGIRILTAFLASGVVVGLLAQAPMLSTVLSVLTALCTAFTAVVDLSKIADKHDHDRRAFVELRAKADSMALGKIDKALGKIRVDAALTLRGLYYPAYNEATHRIGRPDWARPLKRWERFLSLLS